MLTMKSVNHVNPLCNKMDFKSPLLKERVGRGFLYFEFG